MMVGSNGIDKVEKVIATFYFLGDNVSALYAKLSSACGLYVCVCENLKSVLGYKGDLKVIF